MIGNTIKQNKYPIGVGIIIVLLILYKFRFLYLPYYWDEAWPYSVAIHTMYNHGLSFLPSAIPAFVSRGHPMMFFFLGASWMKIFGTSIISGHIFALLISILVLIAMYVFCSSFFSQRIGFISCLVFGSQAVFISQSVFLMPEMLMALWTMLCFYAFFKGKNILFVVFATAMILTKESGGVLPLTLFFTEFLRLVFLKEKIRIASLKKLALICLPVVLASVYFIIQKMTYGWFLFPLYMNYISSQWTMFKDSLPNDAAYVFIYYGRNGFSIFIVISFIVLYFKKVTFSANEKRILPILACYIVLYLIFSSINYFIPRYLLCVFPPFCILGVSLIDKVFSRIKIIYPLIIIGVCITCLIFYFKQGLGGDNDYSPSIKTDMEVVSYCEKENLYNSYIYASSVLKIDFHEPYAGYLSGKPFTHVDGGFSDKTEYCIFSNNENDEAFLETLKKENKIELMQRFTDRYAWREIYKVIK